MKLGIAIRQLRKKRGFTQQQLADMVAVHVTMISRLERDKSCGSITTLQKLAVALDVPLAELLEDQPDCRDFAV